MIISLWMCKNAIYRKDDYIKCAKGRNLGKVHGGMVRRGMPLVCSTCNPCPECDIMGLDVPKGERGWE